MVKAFSYLRVSGNEQITGDGFPRQRDAIGAYAAAAGYQVVAEFRDGGVSGTNELAHRPGLTRLFDALLSNGVRVVLIENSDRLARALLVGEAILAQFRDAGVRVLTASGNDLTDDRDETRVLIRQMLGAIAQFNKSLLVRRLRAGRQRTRATTGRCEGIYPFGSTPSEAATVDIIRTLRRKPRGVRRLSYADIAQQLNDRRVATRSGRPWHAGTVHRILTRTTPKPAALPNSTTYEPDRNHANADWPKRTPDTFADLGLTFDAHGELTAAPAAARKRKLRG